MGITSEIFQIGGQGITNSSDAAVYLIDFNGHAAVVDAGCGESVDVLVDAVMNHGLSTEQVEYLLITHCHFDHTGGARALRERLECRVVCHGLDAVYLEAGNDMVTAASWYGSRIEPVIVDMKLAGRKNTISLGGRTIEAIHIPGHSPGSVAYVTESDGKKVLFGQDVHGPLHPDLLSVRADYLESLERMRSMDADILCEGHFGVYKGKKKVRSFISSYMNS